MCWMFLFVCLLFVIVFLFVVVVEVCDVFFCFGLSFLVVVICNIVCNEYWLWFCFFIDCDGCVVSFSVIEVESDYLVDNGLIVWQCVVGYWCNSGMFNVMGSIVGVSSCVVLLGMCYIDSDCCVFLIDNLWLVVFIFWVMVQVGVFGFNMLLCYIDYICVVYQGGFLGVFYWLVDLVMVKFVLGDLLCFLCDCSSMFSYSGLVQVLGNGLVGYWKLYCEVVVVVNFGGDQILYLVGGNVMNIVVMCLLLLDCIGLIKLLLVCECNSIGIDFSCMLGCEDECSFNCQDWVVLLQLMVIVLLVMLLFFVVLMQVVLVNVIVLLMMGQLLLRW